MNKVLLATGVLLALSGLTARLYARREANEARFDLYQRRQWCPAWVRTDVGPAKRGHWR
jgi:hypothetical protein